MEHNALGEQPSKPVNSSEPMVPTGDRFFGGLRMEALTAVDSLALRLGAVTNGSNPPERSCFGHKQRILGLELSPCGNFLATASEDSTVIVWEVKSHRLLQTLKHDSKHECLRVTWAFSSWCEKQRQGVELNHVIATGGADGKVTIFRCSNPRTSSWSRCYQIDHASLCHFRPAEDDDKPQVYYLQFVNGWRGPIGRPGEGSDLLLTSSDDHIHLWKPQITEATNESDANESIQFHEVTSFGFTSLEAPGGGLSFGQVSRHGDPSHLDSNFAGKALHPASNETPFGGARNPNNLIYVFDAEYNARTGLLAVALSDGSARILNCHGICLSVLQLPGVESHLTSLAWEKGGHKLSTCVGNGHTVIWEFHGDPRGGVQPRCCAVMEGGHAPGRPLFGSQFISHNSISFLLTWGVDGKVCIWDASVEGYHQPLRILVQKSDYPLFAFDMNDACMVLGGGGLEVGFLGTPVYIVDISS